jgi:uncharacterized protein (TIGR02611 family)
VGDNGAVQMMKRSAVTIAGALLLAVGVAMMVLPGPGILLIVAGLAVLATEYAWARRLLKRAQRQARSVQAAAVSSPLRTAGSVLFAVGLLCLGVAMFVVADITWPAQDARLDAVWGPVTAGVLVLTSLILLTTTYITIRTAKGEETTYTRAPAPGSTGATRLRG